MIQFSKTARLETKDPVGPTPLEPASGRRTQRSGTDAGSDVPLTGRVAIVLIEPRTLIRDCLSICLETANPGEAVYAFASTSDWANARTIRPVVPLFLLSKAHYDEAEIEREMDILSQMEPRASIVLLSDDADTEHVLGALDRGARGYISTRMPLDVAVKAIHLVRAGGTFVPAESLRASKLPASEPPTGANVETRGPFTTRQLAVIEALRQGKANKIIAFELNMRESTVKVHVRNIMKKLQAKNRTEVAFRVNAMASLGKSPEGSSPGVFTKSLP